MGASVLQKVLRESHRTVFVVVLVLGLMAILVAVSVTPPGATYAPRSLPRAYKDASLEVVIHDLEENEVIPQLTEWESEELRERAVTVSWIWPTDKEALDAIAVAAGIVIDCSFDSGIDYSWVVGPCVIRSQEAEQPGLYALTHGYRYGPWPNVEPRPRRR
ncbi:MAG TPA: hypothetical protein VLK65_18555 [Vicinamibacteria bacterium]|nr:hypothetical protein [Vicinamibacteria bacterium]